MSGPQWVLTTNQSGYVIGCSLGNIGEDTEGHVNYAHDELPTVCSFYKEDDGHLVWRPSETEKLVEIIHEIGRVGAEYDAKMAELAPPAERRDLARMGE